MDAAALLFLLFITHITIIYSLIISNIGGAEKEGGVYKSTLYIKKAKPYLWVLLYFAENRNSLCYSPRPIGGDEFLYSPKDEDCKSFCSVALQFKM